MRGTHRQAERGGKQRSQQQQQQERSNFCVQHDQHKPTDQKQHAEKIKHDSGGCVLKQSLPSSPSEAMVLCFAAAETEVWM